MLALSRKKNEAIQEANRASVDADGMEALKNLFG